MEDQHAALPAHREERSAHGIQVRGVRRGTDVRRVAQNSASPIVTAWTLPDFDVDELEDRSMRIKVAFVSAVGALVLAAVVPVVAHHAFAAEFDAARPILIRGKVAKIEWVNPHAWIHIAADEVTLAGETKKLEAPEVWMVEGGTPNTLLRRGITKDTLAYGTAVIVDGFQAKDRSNRANGRDLTFTD